MNVVILLCKEGQFEWDPTVLTAVLSRVQGVLGRVLTPFDLDRLFTLRKSLYLLCSDQHHHS